MQDAREAALAAADRIIEADRCWRERLAFYFGNPGPAAKAALYDAEAEREAAYEASRQAMRRLR